MLAGSVLAGLLASVACAPPPTIPTAPREPQVRHGPTELVAGLYVEGGPAPLPGCPQQPRGPFRGTLTAVSARTGAVVARRTLHADGRLFVLPLAPGTYLLRATSAGGLRTLPQRVTIPAHHTVRQDVFVAVP